MGNQSPGSTGPAVGRGTAGSLGPTGGRGTAGSFCTDGSLSSGAPTASSSEYAPASNASSNALSRESKFGYSGVSFSPMGGACLPPSSPYVSDPATNTIAPRTHRTKTDQDGTMTLWNIQKLPQLRGTFSIKYIRYRWTRFQFWTGTSMGRANRLSVVIPISIRHSHLYPSFPSLSVIPTSIHHSREGGNPDSVSEHSHRSTSNSDEPNKTT